MDSNPTYTARQDAKRRASEARRRAQELAATIGGRVSDYASVKPAEGGCFVDATLWVPDAREPEPFSAASEPVPVVYAVEDEELARLRDAERTLGQALDELLQFRGTTAYREGISYAVLKIRSLL